MMGARTGPAAGAAAQRWAALSGSQGRGLAGQAGHRAKLLLHALPGPGGGLGTRHTASHTQVQAFTGGKQRRTAQMYLVEYSWL